LVVLVLVVVLDVFVLDVFNVFNTISQCFILSLSKWVILGIRLCALESIVFVFN